MKYFVVIFVSMITTVQAEITFRPDFPLATNGGDQGQQISDASGATTLLSIGVAQSVRGACVKVGGSATQADLLTDHTAAFVVPST